MEELARKTLAGINPNLSVVRFQTFTAQIAEQFGQDRLLSRLTMLFAGLALLLATLGLYGVTAFYEKVIKVKADVAAFLVEVHVDGERCQGCPKDVHHDP
jgi:hypothetical protein